MGEAFSPVNVLEQGAQSAKGEHARMVCPARLARTCVPFGAWRPPRRAARASPALHPRSLAPLGSPPSWARSPSPTW